MTMRPYHTAIDKSLATAQRAIPAIAGQYARALAPLKAFRVKAELVSPPIQTIDGVGTYRITAAKGLTTVSWEAPVKFHQGLAVVNADKAKEQFEEVYAPASKVDSSFEPTALPEISLEMAKVSARRIGDGILFTSESLPGFSFAASAEEFKREGGREAVLDKLMQHMAVFAAAELGKTLSIIGEKKLPVVVSDKVEVVAEKKLMPGTYVTGSPELDEALVLEQRMAEFGRPTLLANKKAEGKSAPAPVKVVSRDIQIQVHTCLQAWAQKNKFAKASVLSIDDSRVIAGGRGYSGAIVAEVQYFDQGMQVSEIEMPYAGGKLDPAKVTATDKQKAIEAERVKALQIASEEEAKANLQKIKEQDTMQSRAAAIVHANLGVEASSGVHFMKPQQAMERIPILKALLPTGVKAGDLIEIDQYVYELTATSYNSLNVDPEDGAFLMAVLTDKMPTGKEANMGLFGTIAAALGA